MIGEKKTKQIILLCVKLFYIIYLVFRCHCGEILTEHVVISNAHNNTDCLVPEGKCFLHWNTVDYRLQSLNMKVSSI